MSIFFAHTSFKWANLASHNAGVSVIVVGMTSEPLRQKRIFETSVAGQTSVREVAQINAYLLNAKNILVQGAKSPIALDAQITDGSGALDGGHLILDRAERERIASIDGGRYSGLVRPYLGSSEFIRGNLRWCLWIEDASLGLALQCQEISERIRDVRLFRENAGTRARMRLEGHISLRGLTSRMETDNCLPLFSPKTETILQPGIRMRNTLSITQQASFRMRVHVLSIISSRLHLAWVRTVCGKT